MGEAKTSALPTFSKPGRRAIRKSRNALLALQHPEGYWCFELEADCTIPAEYILMMHYMNEIDEELEARIARYLRDHQADHGGWPLFTGGALDVSCSVKAYYALKLAGDSPDAFSHRKEPARPSLPEVEPPAVTCSPVLALALFGQVPWRAVPFMPVELLLMPRWFPFHMSKVSYWSRTVVVPLLILCSLKPKAANPRKVDVRELFTTPPEEENNYSLPVPDSTCFSLAWIRWAAGWSRGYPAGCERPP